MQRRFKQYLGIKMLNQKDVAADAGLTPGQVSRFCQSGSISLENFRKIISVCNDLSLDYFFFGIGPIIRDTGRDGNNRVTNNLSGDSTIETIKYQEKDRIIAEKDEIIS